MITDYDGGIFDYIITLAETAKNKKTNITLYKNPFASTEEGTATDGSDTHAYSAVDGNTSTRWTAATNGGTEAKYPEWIAVDLGKEYKVSDILLKFETKADRIYSYCVYGSTDIPLINGSADIPEGFEIIADRSLNNEKGGNDAIDCNNKKYRYIAVKVLGCDKWSDKTKYVAASVYELSVNGTNYVNSEELSTETPKPMETPMLTDTPMPMEEIIYNEYDTTVITTQSGTLIICNYDEMGDLIGITINEIQANAPITPTIEITDTTRIYLWDSIKGMKSLTTPWHKQIVFA